MNKLQCNVERVIAHCGATVLSSQVAENGHRKYRIRLPDGTQRELSTSSTPTDADTVLKKVERDVRRLCGR